MSEELRSGDGGAASEGGRGRLTVFLGFCPGAGKTREMLLAGRDHRNGGVDLVVGAVEAHGQSDIEALLRSFTVVPRRTIVDRGRFYGEMDLDAILARRPTLVLVDDWAHVNAPGSRHERRFEDIEALLAAGIDVHTTLDVQHVESLNDEVARISHVRIRDTLPDRVFETADRIELVDPPPDELRRRFREGKVHVGDPIGGAIRHFFSEASLAAFRAMALRLANRPADTRESFLSFARNRAGGNAIPREARLLVCVDAAAGSETIVEEGHRLAHALRADWIVLYVQTPRHDRLDDRAKDRVAALLRMGERLGAETMTLPAKSGVSREIVDYAKAHGATHIVLGRSRVSRVGRLLKERVAAGVARLGTEEQIVLVPRKREGGGIDWRWPAWVPTGPVMVYDFAWATAGIAAATAIAAAVERMFSVSDLSFIFLTAVLVIASRFGVWPALYAGVLSFISVIYFFASPYYVLSAMHEQDVTTLGLFLVVATLTGNLAGRLRRHLDSIRVGAHTMANLYELSRKIAAAGSLDDVLQAANQHVASALECQSVILLMRNGALEVVAEHPPESRLGPADRAAAERSLRQNDITESAAGGAEAIWQFRALPTQGGAVAVLGVRLRDQAPLGPERRRLLDAMTNQVAVAIERTLLMMDIEDVRLLNETERLRAALLSSVSHDLKTPLVSIIGATTALSDDELELSEPARKTLVQAVLDDATRLYRFVQNLLDMTRISYGALTINRRWCELGEIVGGALKEAGKTLARHRIRVDLPTDLPEVLVDPVLMEHVVVNLLDNAAKYAPAGTVIGIAAGVEGRDVRLDVTDEGPGIPESEREAVFDQFYRIRVEDRQVAGTGLGLSICRGLVEAHGGKVAISDGPNGTGACVSVTFPLESHLAPPVPRDDTAAEEQEP